VTSLCGYELGGRESPLPVPLDYAKSAGTFVDAWIDDEVRLSEKLPSVRGCIWLLKRTLGDSLNLIDGSSTSIIIY
jgi:hypothetical protein